jgi:hypothetical protein
MEDTVTQLDLSQTAAAVIARARVHNSSCRGTSSTERSTLR